MKLKFYLVRKTIKKAMKVYNCIHSYEERINYCKDCGILLNYIIYINLSKEVGFNEQFRHDLLLFFKTELEQSWYSKLLKKDLMRNVIILWRLE